MKISMTDLFTLDNENGQYLDDQLDFSGIL